MQFVLGYIDPGSGSLLLQLLVGGSAGAWMFAKYLFRRFWSSGETAAAPCESAPR